ncbi:MAG: HAMP domain-containing histidine kinase [Porticoccus sp.]|nr:HAMP domain-containing histidine kinase [Porticoccus sp.]
MMNLLVFYKLNGHFLWVEPEFSGRLEDRVFIPESEFSKFQEGGRYQGEYLNSLIEGVFNPRVKYNYLMLDRYVVFYKYSWLMNLLLRKADDGKGLWLSSASSLLYEFRHKQKENLLEKITQPLDLHGYLKVLTDYVFCDHYSLWSYNKHTFVFTCEASSFACEENEYIRECGENGLSVILTEDYIGHETRPINEKYLKSDSLTCLGMRSLNRIKLSVGDNEKTVAVVNFYSKRDGFYLDARALNRLRSLVENKYIESVQVADEQLYELNNSTSPHIEKQSLDEYLVNFVSSVCKKLKYEACSIFLLEDEGLTLKATADFEKTCIIDGVTYSMDEPSMTVRVAKEQQILCSYNLQEEETNSHRYDEKTEHDASNWIGLPLIDDDVGLVGVIRVKNKYVVEGGVRKVRQPRPLNFINLIKASVILRVSINIFKKYNDLNEKLKNQNNFNRVLLHEIRTPISKFNMGPEIIKRSLEREDIDETKKRKIINQLSDIQVLGGRLKLITDAYNFRDIVSLKQKAVLPLLHSVIYPILNITKPFLEKQHDCYIDLDVPSLHSWKVVGDSNLYGMALNALVDNAAKYCHGNDKRIRIYGSYKYGDPYLELSVRNKGFPIKKEDRKKIFDEGFRTSSVIDEKIHGTGIGLYLAKTIMDESDGELRLRCHYDPEDIEFVMVMPAASEGEEE